MKTLVRNARHQPGNLHHGQHPTDSIALLAEFISPNAIRHQLRKQKGEKFAARVNQNEAIKAKKAKLQLNKKEDKLSRNNIFS